ncbi:purine nucleoside permease [Lyngbya confervoides]|uniref:Uncharacterized protein n=1 Tax=Lyngbya confervoides BDU141951 TaxID=1574623 RepID=A0ABD4T8U4_9CYAN|nr:purine nucleoside permease [Lyngbya confervoides]MCM1985224.1 hypothetical protein [Lyngbya confervoides BDU141951]
MKRSFAIATLCIAGLVSAVPATAQVNPAIPSATQSEDNLYFLSRAKNLARQAAINANGGLNAYRPELSMYGPAVESPYERNDDGSITFNFLGGSPGSTQFETETTVRVSPDSSVSVVYNGPARGGVGGGSLERDPNESILSILSERSFLTRAQNLARQAGIRENGGLSVYRPESTMFGPTDEAPVQTNPDGSATFTFKGGPPLASAPTVETQVTVTRQGQILVDYNGVPR